MSLEITVDYLKSIDFSELSFSEQYEIKLKGRPMPNLILVQEATSNNKKYIRSFKKNWYNKVKWLCGCETRNSLFCFPCLLYGGDDSPFTQRGFNQLNKIKHRSEKHQDSVNHKKNVFSLYLLGPVETVESEALRLSRIEHNEQVQKNRDILSKLIDAILFCGEYELPLRGHDENGASDKDVFQGLLKYSAKLNQDMRDLLNSNSCFKDTSETIQNELLQCILDVCRDRIAAEIKETNFLAVMTDDTTDVSGERQTAIVFRYERHGQVFERFWGYFNSKDVSAGDLSKLILTQLKTVLDSDHDKLIAQTHDVSHSLHGMHTMIRNEYKNANYIHCYAHQVNVVMEQLMNSIKSVRTFFSDLSSIPAFFLLCPKRLEFFKDHMKKSFSRVSITEWYFNERTVNSVYEVKEELTECFHAMTIQTDETYDTANDMLSLMRNETFLFWLDFFRKIMLLVETLHTQKESRNIDPVLIQKSLDSFCASIQQIRDSESCACGSQSRIADSKEVCDRILLECRQRFAVTRHLLAAKLFYAERFPTYHQYLPKLEIAEACKIHPSLRNEVLRAELSIMYSEPESCHFGDLLPLLQRFLSEEDLRNVFEETVRLLKILVTMPTTTAEPGRCFSTLKQIKSYLRNSLIHERLVPMCMISMEKRMIREMYDFNHKVMEKFLSKTKRKEFILNHPGMPQIAMPENTNDDEDELCTGSKRSPLSLKQEEDVYIKCEPDLEPLEA